MMISGPSEALSRSAIASISRRVEKYWFSK